MEFDVIVVGSGAGGGMAALRLCERGYKVCLIERGPKFDPKKDYIFNYADWHQRVNPLNAALDREDSIDWNYNAPINDNDNSRRRNRFYYHRVFGVGGSTLHYQGEAHRFPEHSFDSNTRYGWGADWPLSYSDLAPYYSQAENLLGVAGEAGNPFKSDRESFPCAAHPLSNKSRLLALGAEQAGMQLLPNTLALPTKSFNGRTPCQRSGGCNYGCVFNAKSSMDQTAIPQAEATGNLTLLSETRVIRLECGDATSISNVVARTGKDVFTLSAKRYVLSLGAVETPRLLLASRNEHYATGIGNSYDQVGRYFMETVTARLSLRLEADFQTHQGPPLEARIWNFNKPETSDTLGFVLGLNGYLYPLTAAVRHALNQPGIGRAHKQRVRDTFGKRLELFGVAEQEPLARNRVLLSERIDRHGVPKVAIHCTYSERDTATLKAMHTQLRAWADATPQVSIRGASDTRRRPNATHVGGTCRMGNTPEQSVVDAFGKVHSLNNTHIADASVFVTQGAGDSPSLTIQALALRTADKIADELKQ